MNNSIEMTISNFLKATEILETLETIDTFSCDDETRRAVVEGKSIALSVLTVVRESVEIDCDCPVVVGDDYDCWDAPTGEMNMSGATVNIKAA